MKRLIFSVLITFSVSTYASWTDMSLSEPSVGCLAVGGANTMMMPDGADTTQTFITGCLIGGIAGYVIDNYYTNKVSDRYESRINTLQDQLDEIILQQSINSSQGVEDYGLVIKKEIVPGKKLRDGSIQLPTIRLKTDLPGRDIIIGD